ncbi:MAG: TetR/AcrR family transcriptional regulator [Motiliproteus sp.]|nr:TetR/AcrR family transcriptional regulator [Motiliproteus sp.]MCW9051976.1 TetR/AcrR family transcriptional regulator [Motiliproteus sp.]
MSPASKGQQTREHILKQGLQLFNDKGYHGTGLKEILDAAGIPKGSFYHYFESKEHFAVEIINHYRAIEFDRWESYLADHQGDRLSQIRDILEIIIAEYEVQTAKIGCLIANLSGELANSSPYFRKAIQASTEQVLQCIEEDMVISQQQGTVRTDIPPRELALLFWDTWQGAMLRMKVSRSTAPLKNTVTLLLDNLFLSPEGSDTRRDT